MGLGYIVKTTMQHSIDSTACHWIMQMATYYQEHLGLIEVKSKKINENMQSNKHI